MRTVSVVNSEPRPGSSRASVLLIATAMRRRHAGASPFDFEEVDAGVDRYAEFGAERVPKWKVVRIRGLWKPRWQRQDLFPVDQGQTAALRASGMKDASRAHWLICTNSAR